MPLESGDHLGRYEVLGVLGRGGMGMVYRARDTVLHRGVALKVLQVDPGADAMNAEGRARLLREGRAAARIQHPNAVEIYDVGEVDGVIFLAMELVLGRTLRSFIGTENITLSRRMTWLVEIAGALGAAHRLGIVHRDVKPENVMVRTDGVIKVPSTSGSRALKPRPIRRPHRTPPWAR